MSKKSTTKTRDTVFSAGEIAPERKKQLDIKQIRTFTEKLRGLPEGAALPDWSELSIGDRFAIVLRLIPANQHEALMGKSAGHLRRYERGVDIPLTVVAALAAETEIPMEWIVSGKAMDRRSPTIFLSSQHGEAAAEDVPIQKLAFKAAAGRGEMILDESADHIRFPRAILQHLGVPPQNARLMEARGESMRATINDGDLMLVDVSQNALQIVEGKIYVFSIDSEAYVKRLRRTPSAVIMISDNREMFPPEEVPKETPFKIFGRVMWAGRSL